MIGAFRQDSTFAFRTLRRQPGFTLAVILCLALGIGAVTAKFTVVNSVLLSPLPYENSDRIVRVLCNLIKTDLDRIGVSVPEYIDYREQVSAFEESAVYTEGFAVNLTGDSQPNSVKVVMASASFFSLLGVEAAEGRVFYSEEDQPGNQTYAVLSDRLWRSQFGSRDVVGQTLLLDDEPHAILGVMPPSFQFPEPDIDLWVPVGLDLANPGSRRFRYLSMIARLRSGVDLEAAQAEVELFEQRGKQEYSEAYSKVGWEIYLVPIQQDMVRGFRFILLTLFGAVGFILLIVCANVANLLLVRSTRRGGEMAVRTALGASPLRLVRQLLTESLYLGLFGGVVGCGMAWLLLRIVAALNIDLPRQEEIAIDFQVFLFAFTVSVVTSLLFGLAPALQAVKVDLVTSLKEAGRSAGLKNSRRLRSLFVVGEVALALVVAVGAGLIVKSLAGAQRVDPGFETERILTLQTNLSYATPRDRVVGFYSDVTERLKGLPGVEMVGATSHLPLATGGSEAAFSLEEYVSEDGDFPSADLWVVTPEYHQAMEIPLLEGRYLSAADSSDGDRVVLIDEKLAQRFWSDTSAIGQNLRVGSGGDGPPLRIVGVVGHIEHAGLDVESKGQLHIPHAQQPNHAMYMILRTADDRPDRLGSAAQAAIRELQSDVPIKAVHTMQEVISNSLADRRFTVIIFAFFAGLALLLAAIGVYSVIAYSVQQRRKDLSMHLALGAKTSDIFRLVIVEGLVLTAVGVVVGLLVSIATTRYLSSLLFGVAPNDLTTFLVVAGVLLTVAVAASFVPALRSTRLAPSSVLRGD